RLSPSLSAFRGQGGGVLGSFVGRAGDPALPSLSVGVFYVSPSIVVRFPPFPRSDLHPVQHRRPDCRHQLRCRPQRLCHHRNARHSRPPAVGCPALRPRPAGQHLGHRRVLPPVPHRGLRRQDSCLRPDLECSTHFHPHPRRSAARL